MSPFTMFRPTTLARTLALALALCAGAHGLAGCATEVRSVTNTRASLEFEQGLAGIWLTDRIGGEDADFTPSSLEGLPVRELAVDGETALLAGGGSLSFQSNAALTTAYLAPGTVHLGIVTGGRVLLEAGDIALSPDRFTYLVAYGTEEEPALHVFSDDIREIPAGSRRVRIINVIPTREAIDFGLHDYGGHVLAGSQVHLAYGEAWSEIIPDSVDGLTFTSDEGVYQMGLNCDPATAILVDAYPSFLADSPPLAPHERAPGDPNLWCESQSCGCSPETASE